MSEPGRGGKVWVGGKDGGLGEGGEKVNRRGKGVKRRGEKGEKKRREGLRRMKGGGKGEGRGRE